MVLTEKLEVSDIYANEKQSSTKMKECECALGGSSMRVWSATFKGTEFMII